ncbi:hypothetical protein PFICI_11708 [Pestalotiopsis fici W106-1]|uniref:Uncharacterized protein n=1 Tax=Pestalotiopsis fici (strain W106-1 / CGMCC3.15140) TaxID=1229662 RepID=W3WU06_PESFW|nr:uncharacterized protein PFICI_11708 [Pestalotiopsis fici W106-1]ETS76321.1 hypothetical protein PFICI_11708 [Pestalotiopsis fici W106-1]
MSELNGYIIRAEVHDPPAWGYAVYRTAYGAATDEPWRLLLEAIRTEVRRDVLSLRIPRGGNPSRYSDEETQRCEEFLSLLTLDTKEDQSTLQGASMDRVREIIKETDPLPTEDEWLLDGTLTTRQGVFLYVDDEVLESVAAAAAAQTPTPTGGSCAAAPWIKMVELDYEPEKHKGNIRVGPQYYFGWMKVSTDSFFQLWSAQEGKYLWSFAPPSTDERTLPIWNGIGMTPTDCRGKR